MIETSIKNARKSKGLTQAELAKLMGVHQTNITAWEKGKWLPTAKKLIKLSQLLDCTVDELLMPEATEA